MATNSTNNCNRTQPDTATGQARPAAIASGTGQQPYRGCPGPTDAMQLIASGRMRATVPMQAQVNQHYDPLADERESARRERVEKLLSKEPRLTTGKAMKFTKTAQQRAEWKAKATS